MINRKNCKIFYMKRKSQTPSLPFSPRFLLRSLPDIFLRHVGLGSPFTPSLYKRPYMLPMEIYAYLSYRRKIKYGIDSSESLNGSGCSLLMFIRSTIPMISADFLTRWNVITVGKGREKGQF